MKIGMRRVLIAGCGRIGQAVALMLKNAALPPFHPKDDDVVYQTYAVDGDVSSAWKMRDILGDEHVVTSPVHAEAAIFPDIKFDYVINCLPFQFTIDAAVLAIVRGAHYLDLTEDRAQTTVVKELEWSEKELMAAPQCGLAPGFVGVLGQHMAAKYGDLRSLKLRIGSLPRYPLNDPLNYNRLWSPEGLVNEYLEPCQTIRNGAMHEVQALEGLEKLRIDGAEYEAFHTSGGVGSLCADLLGHVRDLDYKSIRYPGHRDSVVLLRDTLGMTREKLVEVFEALPSTVEDVVLVVAEAVGKPVRGPGPLESETWSATILPIEIGGTHLLAIQATTAAAICAVMDMHAGGRLRASGVVEHRDVNLDDFLDNRFGSLFVDE